MMEKSESEVYKNKYIAEFAKQVGRVPFPECYKCSTKVRKMWLDVELTENEHYIIVMANCHGENQELLREPVWKIPYMTKIDTLDANSSLILDDGVHRKGYIVN